MDYVLVVYPEQQHIEVVRAINYLSTYRKNDSFYVPLDEFLDKLTTIVPNEQLYDMLKNTVDFRKVMESREIVPRKTDVREVDDSHRGEKIPGHGYRCSCPICNLDAK